MLIPRRSFSSVAEAAARLSITPFELIGLAMDGLLEVSVVIPPVKAESGEDLCGLVDVEAACLLPLFRADGTPSHQVTIRRVKTKNNGIQWIAEPGAGLPVTAADVFVRRTEIERFEQRYRSAEKARKNAGGAPPRYDWDAFSGAVARFIHENGIPERQSVLVHAMLNWFDSNGLESPDPSTIRKKIAVVWRELHNAV